MDRSVLSPNGHRTRIAASLFAALCAMALAGTARAADLLVSSEATDQVLRYDGQTGAFVGVFASGNGMSMPEGLTFGADGNLYVANIGSNRILRFNGATGAFIDEMVPAASGIGQPVGIGFHAGTLYVGERTAPSITRYDAISGAALGMFASGGLIKPDAFVFSPGGDLFVSDRDNDRVVRFDGITGAAKGIFASGAELSQPEIPLFGADGKLYVVSRGTNAILRYDGTTGALIDTFASDGLDEPFGMCRGPDDNLYVANVNGSSVTRYDGVTGALIDIFVPTGSGGLATPTFLTFMPTSLGDACAQGSQCPSGFCVDGVCCDTACGGGTCDACSVAAGAAVNGTCVMLSNSVVCPADACHEQGACDAATGMCPEVPKKDGTPCNGGTCSAGECMPSTSTGSTSTGGAGGNGAGGGTTGGGGDDTTSTTVVGGCGCDVVGSQTANALWAQVGFILLVLARRRREKQS